MDIDIDVADRDQLLSKLTHRIAKLENGKPHNTGVYFSEIPHNPLDGMSTIDHKEAEKRGYFKIDLLNVNIYKDVKSNAHMEKLVNQEPMWELLQYEEVTKNLFHVSNHGIVLRVLKPKSIEELAMALAIIRPSKKHLLNEDWDTIRSEIWKQPEDDAYWFKKAHAFSYSLAVVVHLNLLCERLLNEADEQA